MDASFYADPFSGEGVLVTETPLCRTWICQDKNNPQLWHQCAVEWTDPLYEQNAAIRNETAGQRFGDWRHVSSIPMNVYFDKVLPAKLNGDQKYLRKFLNDSDNRKFKTFERKI